MVNEAPPVPRRIRLTRPFRVSGFVVDAKGRRVPGARVMPWNRPREVGRKLADLAFEARPKTSFCDVKGNFEVVVPFGNATHQIHAWALMKDGVWHGVSVWVDVSKSGKSEVVRVQIPEN